MKVSTKISRGVWSPGHVVLQGDGWYAAYYNNGANCKIVKTLSAAKAVVVAALVKDFIDEAAQEAVWAGKACKALKDAAEKVDDPALAQRCEALVEIKEEE